MTEYQQDSAWDDSVLLPRLRTAVPGPLSRKIHRQQLMSQAPGISAGATWSGLAVIEGRGAMVRDADGNYLLDACSGTVVMNIGHGDPEIAAALAEQARRLVHFYDFASPVRVEFLHALSAVLPESLNAIHLVNSGTEAVETALRIARSASGRHEVIAFHDGFHGRSLGALSLTAGNGRTGLGPFLPGVVHAPPPHRVPGNVPAEQRVDASMDYLELVVAQQLTAPPAAVIIEPVQGAGGTNVLPAEFLTRLRGFCDEHGTLLIFDEILTGAGRTGTFWAFEHSGVVPDLLLAGKGLAGGYPLGLVAGARDVMSAGPVALPTRNSSTFGGGQLACAAGLAALDKLLSGKLVQNSAEVGAYLIDSLRREIRHFPLVKDVRGLGLMIGIELDSRSAPDAAELPRAFLLELLRRGVVISSTSHVVRITPPLCLTREQADVIVQAVSESLEALSRG